VQAQPVAGQRQPRRRRKKLHDLSGVGSVGITARGPLDKYRFNMFMRDLLGEKARDIFRSKGVLCIKGQEATKFVFQGVHETICFGPAAAGWQPGEELINQIVFIGRDLDRAVRPPPPRCPSLSLPVRTAVVWLQPRPLQIHTRAPPPPPDRPCSLPAPPLSPPRLWLRASAPVCMWSCPRGGASTRTRAPSAPTTSTAPRGPSSGTDLSWPAPWCRARRPATGSPAACARAVPQMGTPWRRRREGGGHPPIPPPTPPRPPMLAARLPSLAGLGAGAASVAGGALPAHPPAQPILVDQGPPPTPARRASPRTPLRMPPACVH
jgi:hypothetical protein